MLLTFYFIFFTIHSSIHIFINNVRYISGLCLHLYGIHIYYGLKQIVIELISKQLQSEREESFTNLIGFKYTIVNGKCIMHEPCKKSDAISNILSVEISSEAIHEISEINSIYSLDRLQECTNQTNWPPTCILSFETNVCIYMHDCHWCNNMLVTTLDTLQHF